VFKVREPIKKTFVANLEEEQKLQQSFVKTIYVTTLALGLQLKQRGCKVAGQEEAQESHYILLGV